MTSGMVTGYNKGTLGEQELTITYGGQTAKYKVTVKDYVTGITVSPNTITRKVGDELVDLITDNNIQYTVNYAKAGGSTPEPLVAGMITGYNKTSKIGRASCRERVFGLV